MKAENNLRGGQIEVGVDELECVGQDAEKLMSLLAFNDELEQGTGEKGEILQAAMAIWARVRLMLPSDPSDIDMSDNERPQAGAVR